MGDGAMIAFLPSDGTWCKQDLPHMTLVYAGPTEELQPADFNEMGKDAISVARLTHTFSLSVTGVEEWGETEDETVDVLALFPTPQLLLARKLVEHWNKSQHKDFSPHATIGPAGSALAMEAPNYNTYERPSRVSTLPSQIYFDRIAACWDDKKLIFNLGDFY